MPPLSPFRETSATEPVVPFRPKVKSKDPDLYDGKDNQKLSSFITQVRMDCDVLGPHSMDEEQKILFAAGFLRNNAFAWWEPHYAQPRINRPAWMFDFELFARELQLVFGNPDRRATAKRDIRHLSQGRNSVSNTTVNS